MAAMEIDQKEQMTNLAKLKAKFWPENKEISSSSSPRIQCAKVPESLRSDLRGSEDPYKPKLVSLGPYHHGDSSVTKGEILKLKLAKAYFRGDKRKVDEVYKKIWSRIAELKACYEAESRERYNDEEFTEMLVVDGCALLWCISYVCLGVYHEDCNIRYQDLGLLQRDALLLENQLPYQLLHELMNTIEGTQSANETWTIMFQEFFGMIEESFCQEFLGAKETYFQKEKNSYSRNQSLPIIQKRKSDHKESIMPCHLLDFYRLNFLGEERSCPMERKTGNAGIGIDKKGRASIGDLKEQVMVSFRNVNELMAAGIRIKPSPTRYLRDIRFTSNGITGCLRLPPITIDKSTETIFMNLVAYEMSSDDHYDFVCYLRFLDSLVDHADDVKQLQSAGVLQNNLGTHEQVAEFFNTVSANLESNFHAYKDVRVKIRKHLESHYNSKLRIWMTQCLEIYFGSPWTIIAWLGAVLALFLTAIQTYFSAFPH